ncbi:MAG: TauD/TfdA family dioxygenase [Gammaproteobacteria bacterium]|nr:TauD/TfdA family dioxygenase [Gammaproteobacteria bacterium]
MPLNTNPEPNTVLLNDKDFAKSPFSLCEGKESGAYRAWREEKLANFPDLSEIIVDVGDGAALTLAESKKIRSLLKRCGMAIFRGSSPMAGSGDETHGRDVVAGVSKHYCLKNPDKNPYADEDALTPLHVAAGKARIEDGRKLYIPYTDKAINWHTDGYYNPPERTIRTMLLYCVRPAKSGGKNMLFDPEIAYLLMRDADIEMVRALAHPQAMTIPANEIDEAVTRDDVTGPVFSIDRQDGSLRMRYTARKKNVIWRDDADTARALKFLGNMLSEENEKNNKFMFEYGLKAGEGLICNNVLHARTAFVDGDQENEKRFILRGRYKQRIAQI